MREVLIGLEFEFLVVKSGKKRIGDTCTVEMWGTWEELVLGGAVVKHGVQDWDAVALELRSRVLQPCFFTPQVCKAKYEDLRTRYSGCRAWYEELRNRRVADLKRELEKSKDAIGSLESQMKCLKAETSPTNQIDHNTLAESLVPVIKSEDVDFSGRETPKDGLSAGSFTQDTRMNCLSESKTPAATSVSASDMKPETSKSLKQDEFGNINVEGNCKKVGVTLRKRRGKRKRKDSCDKHAKEGSIAESDNLGSINAGVAASRFKETSASECNHTHFSSGTDDRSRDLWTARNGDDLMGIFISIAQDELASVFRHRLDSQKRTRYKKIIRRHLDFGTLRSSLVNGSIKSAKELFRDLLLLTNNALVFYSKRTREYKSAFSLRAIVKKAYRQHSEKSYNKATSRHLSSLLPFSNPPSKPRSARARPHPRPCKENPSPKFQCANNIGGTSGDNEKWIDLDSNIPLRTLLVAAKSLKRPATLKGKVSRKPRPKQPLKERKKLEKQT